MEENLGCENGQTWSLQDIKKRDKALGWSSGIGDEDCEHRITIRSWNYWWVLEGLSKVIYNFDCVCSINHYL